MGYYRSSLLCYMLITFGYGVLPSSLSTPDTCPHATSKEPLTPTPNPEPRPEDHAPLTPDPEARQTNIGWRTGGS